MKIILNTDNCSDFYLTEPKYLLEILEDENLKNLLCYDYKYGSLENYINKCKEHDPAFNPKVLNLNYGYKYIKQTYDDILVFKGNQSWGFSSIQACDEDIVANKYLIAFLEKHPGAFENYDIIEIPDNQKFAMTEDLAGFIIIITEDNKFHTSPKQKFFDYFC